MSEAKEVRSLTFEVPEQVVLIKDRSQARLALLGFLGIILLLNLFFSGLIQIVFNVVVGLGFLVYLTASEYDEPESVRMDFHSSLLLTREYYRYSVLPFVEVSTITVSEPAFFVGTQTITLSLTKGRTREIGPFRIPPGLITRFKRACPLLIRGDLLLRKDNCCQLPVDTALSELLKEMANQSAQKATFWKVEEWLPQDKTASAYYRCSACHLWCLRFTESSEWSLEDLGVMRGDEFASLQRVLKKGSQ